MPMHLQEYNLGNRPDGVNGVMSLVMAFSGVHGAVMAGDHREILFMGDRSNIGILETSLYTNEICTDTQLKDHASALGVAIVIRDDKSKVREKDGLLIGEVTETDGTSIKRRRLCVSCGHYSIGEKISDQWTIRSQGEGSNFIVLGNQATRDIAHRCIRDHWKKQGGSLQDAVRVIILSMQESARTTATVSATYTLVQTRRNIAVPGSHNV